MTEQVETKRKAPAGTGAGDGNGAGANISCPEYSTTPSARQAPLDAALAYAARGWAVFPVGPDKAPRCGNGFHDATTDAETIRAMWRDHPGAGVAVACGAAGLVVVDCDVKRGIDGIGNFEALGIDGDPLQSETPSTGRHLIYSDTTGGLIRNSAGKLAPGLDVRASGGYILLPPSSTPGGAYTALGDWNRNPGPLPEELRDRLLALQAKAEPALAPPLSPAPRNGDGDPGRFWLDRALAEAAPGNRNENGFWLACQLRDAGLGQAEAQLYMAEYARRVPQGGDPYTEAEAMASLQAAYSEAPRPPAQALGGRITVHGQPIGAAARNDAEAEAEAEMAPLRGFFRWTDMGNAERLVARHGQDLRYCHSWGRWLAWDGLRWATDETGEIARKAKSTVRGIYADASLITDDDAHKKCVAWALQSGARARLQAMIGLAESEAPVVVRPDALDTDPWLLTVANGTLDLRTGELGPPRRGDLITKASRARYDPQAECPLWLTFLAKIMRGDAELIGFLQRAIGYTLTGITSERCIFLLYGTGANGKSTLLDAVKELLGEYATQTSPRTLMIRRNETIPNDIAALRGARLIASSETEDGQALAESLIKQLAGGTDEITARFLHGEFFSFRPAGKLFLASNHKPTIKGTDAAIWARIRLIPFLETIPPDEQDRGLADKLKAELDGILAWAVRGCLDWQRNGLRPPKAVTSATDDYKTEMDALAVFLDDTCIIKEDNLYKVSAGDLYTAYKSWALKAGEETLTQRAFSARMKERGYTTGERDSITRRKMYTGIGLIKPPTEEPDEKA